MIIVSPSPLKFETTTCLAMIPALIFISVGATDKTLADQSEPSDRGFLCTCLSVCLSVCLLCSCVSISLIVCLSVCVRMCAVVCVCVFVCV